MDKIDRKRLEAVVQVLQIYELPPPVIENVIRLMLDIFTDMMRQKLESKIK